MRTPSQSDTHEQDKDKLSEQNSSTTRKPLIKVFWFFFIIGALLFLPYMYSDDAKYLYQKYLVNNHQELVSYLDKINLTQNSGEEITRNVRLKLYRFN
jgi:hypothetical protein